MYFAQFMFSIIVVVNFYYKNQYETHDFVCASFLFDPQRRQILPLQFEMEKLMLFYIFSFCGSVGVFKNVSVLLCAGRRGGSFWSALCPK